MTPSPPLRIRIEWVWNELGNLHFEQVQVSQVILIITKFWKLLILLAQLHFFREEEDKSKGHMAGNQPGCATYVISCFFLTSWELSTMISARVPDGSNKKTRQIW